jgi:predicted Co/Zn/Cd cation transporter (cation efflux family)
MDKAENKGLIISATGAITVGCVGLVFSKLTGSKAILLDGAFNLVYFVISLLTIKVSKLVFQGDDEHFPIGYSFFEPLINGIKGFLILGISGMAVFDAISALFSGGRSISPGKAMIYGAFAAVTCWTVALQLKKQTRKSASPLLKADADSWIVNAAISSAVLVTFIAAGVISNTSLKSAVPYADPTLVILVSGITIGVPVKIAWNALMGLINRAPSKAIRDEVGAGIEAALADLPREGLAVRVLQPGRSRIVFVHLVLHPDSTMTVEQMDELRSRVDKALCELHALTQLDILFTKDPQWGAPLGKAGSGYVATDK